MTAAELECWLRELHRVEPPSVDRMIAGDPRTEISAVANVWMPTWSALGKAVEMGANVVVAHEPTFYTHWDLQDFEEAFAHLPSSAREALRKARDAKLRWIEANALVILRCHDGPDQMAEGVVDALVGGLGFKSADVVARAPGSRVVGFSPLPAGEMAQRLATSCALLGQPGVSFYGDVGRRVATLGLGTGFGSNLWSQLSLGAEMSLGIDDALQSWSQAAFAEDTGYPLAVVNHGTSEEWGVRRVGELLSAAFPQLRVHHLAQGCGYRWFDGGLQATRPVTTRLAVTPGLTKPRDQTIP